LNLVWYRYERQPSRSPSMTGSLSCLRQLLLVTIQKRSFLTYWNPLLDPVYPSVDLNLVWYRYERQPSRSPSMTGSLSCLRQLLLVTIQKRSFPTYWNPLLDPVQGLTRFWANVEKRGRTEKKGVRKVWSSSWLWSVVGGGWWGEWESERNAVWEPWLGAG
jgi:hypothetical protein